MKNGFNFSVLIALAALAVSAPAFAMGKAPSKDEGDQPTDQYRTLPISEQHMTVDSESNFTIEMISGEAYIKLQYKGYKPEEYGKRDSAEARRIGACNVDMHFDEEADGLKSNWDNTYGMNDGKGYGDCVNDRIRLSDCIRLKKKITFILNETKSWMSKFSCK